MHNVPSSPDPSAGKLQWRCRRGVRELDVLLSHFLQHYYESLNSLERAAFERLLDSQDPVIMDWLFDREQPQDQDLVLLLEKIKNSTAMTNDRLD